jgi:hypothetical protein
MRQEIAWSHVLLCATPRIGSARFHCYLCTGTALCLPSHVSSYHPDLIRQFVRARRWSELVLRNSVPGALQPSRTRHGLMTDQPQTPVLEEIVSCSRSVRHCLQFDSSHTFSPRCRRAQLYWQRSATLQRQGHREPKLIGYTQKNAGARTQSQKQEILIDTISKYYLLINTL